MGQGGMICGGVLVVILFIVSTVLLGVSFNDVDYHYASIKRHTVNKSIVEGEVYLPGK